ncbi:hypothetical protein LTS18_003150 [Coniosporium uncinatum]|uniref:Uncharacterized protein n=1 Tax=Coniosporium uncinatum TaxID=93489 RepID=A0ACC3DCM4_9PEZI|nr:hypothetical protein LTS18_003150 [Coniosporium uncinatum]
MGLTEAEAAAVHTSVEARSIFREYDIILVCDAGGGTTDISLLEVTNCRNGALSMSQLHTVFGGEVGATAIDVEFRALAQKRLSQMDPTTALRAPLETISWDLMKSRDYQDSKCMFGDLDNDTGYFFVRIPGLNDAYSNPRLRISRGHMRFDQHELQAIFDKQIERIFAFIEHQLQRMQRKWSSRELHHLILSGGLGNSEYVQNRLRMRYGSGSTGHANTRNVNVTIAPDPQLVVCKGVVADRARKLKSGSPVLYQRCCRASYGIACKELYNEQNPLHRNRPQEKDPQDGKLYVPDSIVWFVRKGEAVALKRPVMHTFKRKLSPGDPRCVFPTSIMVCNLDPEFLPHSRQTPWKDFATFVQICLQ